MKVSVAMATYNGQEYIEKQIESIFSQTILPDELVICDDGSTDRTLEICATIKHSAPITVTVYTNESNLGFIKNFEKAISLCKGEIIFISDQDDVWREDKIEKMISAFDEDKDIGLVYSNATVVDKNLNATDMTVFSTRGNSEIAEGEDRSPIDVIKNPNIKGCTLAFKSKYISTIFPVPIKYDNRYWGHDHWIAFMLAVISKVSVVDEELMYYRIHQSNTSAELKDPSLNKGVKEWSKISKYSSSSVNRNLQKYDSMIQRLTDIDVRECYSLVKYQNYLSLLHNEKELLLERIEIWKERRIIVRISFIIKYLLSGKYFRFKRFFGPLVKDLLGVYKATT